MTSHRDEHLAGRPSRRRILRAGLAGVGGLGLVGTMPGRARARQQLPGPGTLCITWEVGELEIDEEPVWCYYGQDCQEPWGTYAYFSGIRLNSNNFGCGGPYCFPAVQYHTNAMAAGYAQAMGAPATSPTRRVAFLQDRLRKRGLRRPFPADRRFRPGSQGRVRVLEEGNYRVPLLKHPVHLVLVLVTPPDDQPDHQRHPLLLGIGATTNDPTATPVNADVLRPRVDEQYFLIYRASDDVFFHVLTGGE